MAEYEALAKEIASELGRDWTDCGAYERQSYMDEAERRLDGCPPRNMDELPNDIWRGAEFPFAKNH